MKIAYKHLVKHITEKPSVKELSESLFQLGHEHSIEGSIFDMEFTPNRGDCLSIKGLLRDLSVFYNISFKQELYTKEINELSLNFKNLSESVCPKIAFLKIEIEELPSKYNEELDNYFLDLGVNKNNFFTDISNYISYETGQPTHCYDANKFTGELVFNESVLNEEFETLLGKKINLSEKNAFFSLDNSVINLAGVVGGKSTSCTNNTKIVVVECAYFQPEAILGKSVKYDIKSDASHKFERGVDPNCHNEVLRRFTKLVSENAVIKDVSMIAYNFIENPIRNIPVNVDKINKIIGINIDERKYLNYLAKLGFIFNNRSVEVPSHRSDIQHQNDLAEEVARVIGYNNIEVSTINIPKSEQVEKINLENKLRSFLIDNGFYETINSSFVPTELEKAIKVDNPLDLNRKFMRTNITDSLLTNLLYNERRQKDSIKLFEISDIYSHEGSINKERRLSVIASGRVGHNYEDFSKKIDIKYLASIFNNIFDSSSLKFRTIKRDLLDTKIKSEIISLEVDISKCNEIILDYKELSKPPDEFNQYVSISELPSSFKDISFSIVDFSKLETIQDLLLNFDNKYIKDVYIFDYFNNHKRKEIKIGFRFIFQSTSKTITSTQVEAVLSDIIEASLKIDGVDIPGLK